MYTNLDASADIDTQIDHNKQGIMSVETTCCNQCDLN